MYISIQMEFYVTALVSFSYSVFNKNSLFTVLKITLTILILYLCRVNIIWPVKFLLVFTPVFVRPEYYKTIKAMKCFL